MQFIRKILFVITSTSLLSLTIFLGVASASPNLSSSYQSSIPITPGSLVSLDSAHKGFVIPANVNNSNDLIGVAVSTNGSLLAINITPGDPQVAVGGTANVLVSTINGPVLVGDQVAASPIDGVGMKPSLGSRVIGVALSPFNSNSPGATTKQVKDSKGKTSNVYIGYIPVQIIIGSTTQAGVGVQNPNLLQRIANSIAGHSVSTGPLIISSIIAVVTFVTLIILIYGTITSSIAGVARNPLAKWSIFQALAQVMAMASLIVVMAIIAIYLILR